MNFNYKLNGGKGLEHHHADVGFSAGRTARAEAFMSKLLCSNLHPLGLTFKRPRPVVAEKMPSILACKGVGQHLHRCAKEMRFRDTAKQGGACSGLAVILSLQQELLLQGSNKVHRGWASLPVPPSETLGYVSVSLPHLGLLKIQEGPATPQLTVDLPRYSPHLPPLVATCGWFVKNFHAACG